MDMEFSGCYAPHTLLVFTAEADGCEVSLIYEMCWN